MRYDRARGSLDRHATYIVAVHLAGAARLKTIQYRPALIDAFLTQTGLTLEPQPP